MTTVGVAARRPGGAMARGSVVLLLIFLSCAVVTPTSGACDPDKPVPIDTECFRIRYVGDPSLTVSAEYPTAVGVAGAGARLRLREVNGQQRPDILFAFDPPLDDSCTEPDCVSIRQCNTLNYVRSVGVPTVLGAHDCSAERSTFRQFAGVVTPGAFSWGWSLDTSFRFRFSNFDWNLLQGGIASSNVEFTLERVAMRDVFQIALVGSDTRGQYQAFDLARYESVRSIVSQTAAVTVFDLLDAVPSLSELTQFHAVVYYPEAGGEGGITVSEADRIAFGNTLADFADLGRGVVLTAETWQPTQNLLGRFESAGYNPLVASGSEYPFGSWVSDWVDESSPVMAALQGTTFRGVRYFTAPLRAGAKLLGNYTVGSPLVAVSSIGPCPVFADNFTPYQELTNGWIAGGDLLLGSTIGAACGCAMQHIPLPVPVIQSSSSTPPSTTTPAEEPTTEADTTAAPPSTTTPAEEPTTEAATTVGPSTPPSTTTPAQEATTEAATTAAAPPTTELPTTTSPPKSCRIALVGSDTRGQRQGFDRQRYDSAISYIESSGVVTVIDLLDGVPSKSQLSHFDAVVYYPEAGGEGGITVPAERRAEFGDSLADLVDNGVGVILTAETWQATQLVLGRFAEGPYNPLQSTSSTIYQLRPTTSDWVSSSNPVTSALAGQTFSGRLYFNSGLDNGAEMVANYTNGYPLVAQIKEGKTCPVTALNFSPYNTLASGPGWVAGGDVLIRSALEQACACPRYPKCPISGGLALRDSDQGIDLAGAVVRRNGDGIEICRPLVVPAISVGDIDVLQELRSLKARLAVVEADLNNTRAAP